MRCPTFVPARQSFFFAVMKVTLFLIFLILSIFSGAQAQNRLLRQSSTAVLPTFGSAPETGIQLGFDLIHFRDFAGGDSTSRMSKLFFWGFYTSKQQYSGYGIWQVFTPHENYNFNGYFQTGYWVDRFYRIGNKSDAKVVEYRNNASNILNYANYSYVFTNIYSIFDKKIANRLFGGFVVDYDIAGKNRLLADSISDLKGAVDLNRNNARRVGMGVNLNYDSRDNADNPLKGEYLQMTTVAYKQAIGSDVNYHTLTVDAIKYINTFNSHTLALRIVSEYRRPEGNVKIPVRGLSYNGGISAFRGYYAGTFRANNLVAFETEYRMPINIQPDAGFFQFWRRIGVVAFASGVKVSDNYGSLFNHVNDFHFAVGGGLRYMLDLKQRINVAMDYAVGLDRSVGVDGSRPSGLYFDISEAF